jgi:hypothetical protein
MEEESGAHFGNVEIALSTVRASNALRMGTLG